MVVIKKSFCRNSNYITNFFTDEFLSCLFVFKDICSNSSSIIDTFLFVSESTADIVTFFYFIFRYHFAVLLLDALYLLIKHFIVGNNVIFYKFVFSAKIYCKFRSKAKLKIKRVVICIPVEVFSNFWKRVAKNVKLFLNKVIVK